ncbi:MAG: HD domain-containing protein [Proteobacteria bacterium]|nr:HD domain-containing protein [Pseudomonadota bacterium]
MSVFEELAALYAGRALGSYFGEQVSMLEHGLQAAWFATQDAAAPTLVIAALLHDVGHLVEDVPADLEDWQMDAHHENVGALWLSRHFGREVTEPVALHVAAKRYLCATDATYYARLSAASVVTLGLQGGPMSGAEVAAFERNPHYRDAVRLRQWDDQGKLAGFSAPGFEVYRPVIEAALRR